MSEDRNMQGQAAHASFRSYATGLVLAVILTVLPFWLVMTAAAPAGLLFPAVIALSVAQIGVHLHYFLHIGESAERRWNVIALILATVVVVVVIGGSLWVIHELDEHMMPHAMGAILDDQNPVANLPSSPRN